MAAVKPGEASRAYSIRFTGASQRHRKALEAERERERVEERAEWHARQRDRVRARNAADPWRLPEPRGEGL